jgi:predicted methyltransferase
MNQALFENINNKIKIKKKKKKRRVLPPCQGTGFLATKTVRQ